MKQKLQYAYSIVIFCGVLLTVYFMTDSDQNSMVRDRAFTSAPLRREALILDPAVNQLLEMESAFAKMRKDRAAEPQERLPSEAGEISLAK